MTRKILENSDKTTDIWKHFKTSVDKTFKMYKNYHGNNDVIDEFLRKTKKLKLFSLFSILL